MTNEELCIRIQQGDRTQYDALVKQNSGMIYKIAAGYCVFATRNRGVDMEDLMQAATIGLLSSVDSWDETRGSFISLAVFHMRREIRTALGIRSSKKQLETTTGVLSLHTPIGENDDTLLIDMVADDTAASPQTAAEKENLAQIVREEVARLPGVERVTVEKKWFYGAHRNELEAIHANHYAIEKNAFQKLKRNKRLRALRDDYLTPVYHHKGVAAFQSSFISATEEAVLWRERYIEDLDRRIAAARDDSHRARLEDLRSMLQRT